MNIANSFCTGGEAARAILNFAGIKNVLIVTSMNSVNEYDPPARVIRLSPRTYHYSTLDCIATGAHEAGHALQHAHGYWPFKVRAALFYPARAFAMLLPLGLIVAAFFHSALVFVLAGYGLLAAFHLLTLPIERDASDRAHHLLLRTGIIEFGSEDSKQIKKILRSFLWSYVFAFALAPIWLVTSIFKRHRR